MIPVSTLYDENIDRRKLSEQKNPFEFLPPQEGSEQLKFKIQILQSLKSRLSSFSISD